MSQKNGRAPSRAIDAGRREERERRRDDLVAGADVERHQREQQRIGARRQAEAVLRLRVRGDLRLELGDSRPEDEALLVADLADRRLDLRAQRRVLALQIEQWDLHVAVIEPRCRNTEPQCSTPGQRSWPAHCAAC